MTPKNIRKHLDIIRRESRRFGPTDRFEFDAIRRRIRELLTRARSSREDIEKRIDDLEADLDLIDDILEDLEDMEDELTDSRRLNKDI